MCNTAYVTPTKALRATGWMLLLLAGTSSVVGCSGVASMQDWHYSWTNKHRATAAYHSQTTSAERRQLGSDYGDGFKKGFYDASTGRGCKTPAVPPPCYWSTRYQSCEGQQCIQNWFSGYQCGAAAAEGKGFPSFHEVPVGPCAPRTNSSGCQGCYSPDYCECGQSCGGMCSSGQCSAGVHEAGSSIGSDVSYDDGYVAPNVFYAPAEATPSAVSPSSPNAPDVPPAPEVTDGAANAESGNNSECYVAQTAYQTSYEEMFANGVTGQLQQATNR